MFRLFNWDYKCYYITRTWNAIYVDVGELYVRDDTRQKLSDTYEKNNVDT